MNLLHLPHRRQSVFAPAEPDPFACHCVVHHPVTVAERELVGDLWLLALIDGDEDRAGYLRTQLATICPAAQVCGCGRPVHEHNEMRAA
ncbi:hypothetical protein OG455_41885 [Kitasatospora sp. NBC_01287]|uniref:hypothetical protein n=1 Tax=Kitasatospora sp. NBC_01287 TaxID=2903573 RepID=UPI00224CD597|nr:hypothetical protein [Kitasatospora sp. NBC_01287]MCX4751712.1 hypothetical protein [Kitasatospora sp. NBC_01287]MCX4751996.1 hypothetical protein [Kitasatospora sp. NBC_01287]